MRIYFWSLLAVVSVAATSFGRPPTPVQAIDESTEVLSELETIKMKGIPPKPKRLRSSRTRSKSDSSSAVASVTGW